MKKVHIFNAGPCVLPQPAIYKAIEALKDFKGTGMSLVEISHRSKEWEAVMDETRSPADMRIFRHWRYPLPSKLMPYQIFFLFLYHYEKDIFYPRRHCDDIFWFFR